MNSWLELIKDVNQTLIRHGKVVYIPLAILIILLALIVIASALMGPLTPFVYGLV